MTIDPDVKLISKKFGIDPALMQAVVLAEGNIVKAVQCSFPNVKTRDEALDILCRSAVHAMSDYIKVGDPDGFVQFWANRWAPRGVANDPTDLNKNWPVNVLRSWKTSIMPLVKTAVAAAVTPKPPCGDCWPGV